VLRAFIFSIFDGDAAIEKIHRDTAAHGASADDGNN
jgi:hypothetical protein